MPSLHKEDISCCEVHLFVLIRHTGCEYSLVALRIPIGDRPPLEGIDVRQAEGLKEMVELMESLWNGDPTRRKTFKGSYISEDVLTERIRSNFA